MKEAVDEGGGGRRKVVEERRGRRYKEGDFWGFRGEGRGEVGFILGEIGHCMRRRERKNT